MVLCVCFCGAVQEEAEEEGGSRSGAGEASGGHQREGGGARAGGGARQRAQEG